MSPTALPVDEDFFYASNLEPNVFVGRGRYSPARRWVASQLADGSVVVTHAATGVGLGVALPSFQAAGRLMVVLDSLGPVFADVGFASKPGTDHPDRALLVSVLRRHRVGPNN